MAEARAKSLEELRELVAEYEALPDDLTAQLNWPGYDRLPVLKITCRECGRVKEWPLGIEEVIRMVALGECLLEGTGICEKCRGPEDEEEEK